MPGYDTSMPYLGQAQQTNYSPYNGFDTMYKPVVMGSGGGTGFSIPGVGGDPWEKLLTGATKESDALMAKLKTIYDSYEGAIGNYEGDMKPIMEALNGDIAGLNEYMKGYQSLLQEIKPGMLGGINVEAGPEQRRAQYMGSVASQYGQAEDAQRRQMASQGMNPYANKGASRSMALDRAGALAGASNQAYSDWHQQHNKDVAQQQAATANYAGLYGKQGDWYGDIFKARAALGGMWGNIYDTRLKAAMARGAGYEGLVGVQEQRRAQAMQGQQFQAGLDAQAGALGAQLSAQVANAPWQYDPNISQFPLT